MCALRGIEERAIVRGQVNPICADDLDGRREGRNQDSQRGELPHKMRPARLTDVEITRCIESDRFRIGAVAAAERTDQHTAPVVKIKLPLVVLIWLSGVPFWSNSVTIPLPIEAITVPLAIGAAYALALHSAATASDRSKLKIGVIFRQKLPINSRIAVLLPTKDFFIALE